MPKQHQHCLCNQHNEARKIGTISDDLIRKCQYYQAGKDKANNCAKNNDNCIKSKPWNLKIGVPTIRFLILMKEMKLVWSSIF